MKSTGFSAAGRQRRFEFFRRTSAELCAAILHPSRTSEVLEQYLTRLEDGRLKRAFAAAIDAGQPSVVPISRPASPRSNLWKGLASRRQSLKRCQKSHLSPSTSGRRGYFAASCSGCPSGAGCLRPTVGTAVEHQLVADAANLGGGDRPVDHSQGDANALERAHDRVAAATG